MVDEIRVDYQALQRISSHIYGISDHYKATVKELTVSLNTLNNGGWEGEAASYFFADMYDDVLPGLSRLGIALDETAQTVTKIIDIMRAAEENAANMIRQEETPSGVSEYNSVHPDMSVQPLSNANQEFNSDMNLAVSDEIHEYDLVRDSWLEKAREKIDGPRKDNYWYPFDGNENEGWGHYQWRLEKEAILMWWDTQRKGHWDVLPFIIWDILSPHSEKFQNTRDQLIEWLDSQEPDYTDSDWERQNP
jgi:WXG100 family type VII secretion target